jgi:hypothetical protein
MAAAEEDEEEEGGTRSRVAKTLRDSSPLRERAEGLQSPHLSRVAGFERARSRR